MNDAERLEHFGEVFVCLGSIVVELAECLCGECLVVVVILPAFWIVEAVLSFPVFEEDGERFGEPGERVDEAERRGPQDACCDFVGEGVFLDAEVERDETAHGEPDDKDMVHFLAELFECFVSVIIPVLCTDTYELVRGGVVSPEYGHAVRDFHAFERGDEPADGIECRGEAVEQ